MICAKIYVLMLHAVVRLFFPCQQLDKVVALGPCRSQELLWWMYQHRTNTDYLKLVKAGIRQVFSPYLLCRSLGVAS